MSAVATYKYNHKEHIPLHWSYVLFILVCGIFVVTVLGLILSGHVGTSSIFLIVVVAVALFPRLNTILAGNTIEVYNRYIICGSTIIYYQNITEVNINRSTGIMTLTYTNGRSTHQFVLNRELFPTNARKAFKIEANRQSKFEKVSGKILDAIQLHAPEARIT